LSTFSSWAVHPFLKLSFPPWYQLSDPICTFYARWFLTIFGSSYRLVCRWVRPMATHQRTCRKRRGCSLPA